MINVKNYHIYNYHKMFIMRLSLNSYSLNYTYIFLKIQ